MQDRTKFLHSCNFLHRHKCFMGNQLWDIAHSGVKRVKHFAITHVEKALHIYVYGLLGKNASLASLLHRGGIYG